MADKPDVDVYRLPPESKGYWLAFVNGQGLQLSDQQILLGMAHYLFDTGDRDETVKFHEQLSNSIEHNCESPDLMMRKFSGMAAASQFLVRRTIVACGKKESN